MSKRDEIKRKKELLKELMSGKKVKVKKIKKKKEKKIDADVNHDGVVDEKDIKEVKKKMKKKKD